MTRLGMELSLPNLMACAQSIVSSSSPGVRNLWYMYPQGYICLSEGVHLSLAIEEKNIFTYHSFPNTYTYIIE